MQSDEALKQACRDVLRYHSHRDDVHPEMSDADKSSPWASFIGASIGGGVFTLHFREAVGLLLVSALVGVFFAYFKSTRPQRDHPKRPAAVGASLKYSQAIHRLTHSTDLRAVGPLCEILWLPGRTPYIPLALRKLLPQLQPEHASLLNSKQRNNLLRVLTKPNFDSLELERATVKAMGNIGDAKALPILEKLVCGALGAKDSPDLREDARTALVALQERINPGYVGRNLLRASNAPAVSPDVLLRPSTGIVETPPQELLRPHNSP